MCNCNISGVPKIISLKDLMGSPDIKTILMNSTVIPKQCFMDNDTEAIFLFTWCSNPADLKAVFAQKPYEITLNSAEDVKKVAAINKQGLDVKTFGKNFLELIQDIKIDTSKVSECVAFCD